ncbi:AraC family transcriptional regulator [Microvirga solisilvae]|uniref:AraC family transcriptional regulator n=1 Tax=Microvirga solisilvae TaxID=2919498 RepID=UPI001FAEDA54|nr:AraC family transcriptional regulator [Microvirga solisilvae]
MTDSIGPASEIISNRREKPIFFSPKVLAGSSRTLPPGYIHLGVAKEIAPILSEFNVDSVPLIREAGLDPALFDDGTNVIPHAALGRLLSLCVTRTNCNHFGLLVGMSASILSLGMVGRLMQHSETLGDALRALVSNLCIQNRGSVPSLTVSDDVAIFTFSVYQSEAESADQISDGSLAVAVNAMRSLCGPEWHPLEVLLPRMCPKDQEPYRRHFRAPVRFNQESASIVFPVRDLKLRIPGADPMMRAMLEERIQQMKGAQGSEFSDDIRRLLRMRLTSNHCSADEIAHLLAIHRRTLSRRLKDSGMGYRAITNEIRFEIARQLLTDTQVPLAQIAAALGYSEASAFTRAFRRWSGQTPKHWRDNGLRSDLATA